MSLLKDYTRNLMPNLSDLDADDAGLDLVEVSRRYNIAPEKIVMLNRNENAYGPSPRVREALKYVPLHRYPDSRAFVKALVDYTGYPEENIITGAGLDEIIITLARLFLGPGDRALIPVPTYNLYGLGVRLCGALPVYSQCLPGFDGNSEISDKIKMSFLCSPNNPTGSSLSEETVRAVAESTAGIVFLDEAYAEFAEKNLLKLAGRYENLVVGRTLSKAFGLAGMRLGYAVAPTWLAEEYRCIAPIFGISSLSLAAGVAALHDQEHMRETVARITRERERMRQRINACPSEGNFLYLQTEERSGQVVERMMRKGVVVKDCSNFPGAGEHSLRVSIGRPEENDRFLEAYGSG